MILASTVLGFLQNSVAMTVTTLRDSSAAASGRTLVTADGEFPVDTGQPGTCAAFVIRPEHRDVQPASPAAPGLRGTVIKSV